MNPFMIGLCLPFALAIMWGWWVYSPIGFMVLLSIAVAEQVWKSRQARKNEPPLPEREPLPRVDPDAEARRVMRPANGDVAPVPHAPKPRPYVGPPMKLPKGGLLSTGE